MVSASRNWWSALALWRCRRESAGFNITARPEALSPVMKYAWVDERRQLPADIFTRRNTVSHNHAHYEKFQARYFRFMLFQLRREAIAGLNNQKLIEGMKNISIYQCRSPINDDDIMPARLWCSCVYKMYNDGARTSIIKSIIEFDIIIQHRGFHTKSLEEIFRHLKALLGMNDVFEMMSGRLAMKWRALDGMR